MSNAAAIAQVGQWASGLRSTSGAMPEIARLCAREIENIIARNIARGVGPDGRPWPKTEDGHLPLQHAMKSIRVRAVGPEVVITISGVEARHHLGEVPGGVARPQIPIGALPRPMADAIDRVVREVFARRLAGSR